MRSLLRLITSAAVLAAGLGWSMGASAVERQQVVNGTLYSVIAPTIANTAAGGGSYVRFFNGDQATSVTFQILVVGTCSGTTYGTASISVPSEASPQFALSTILTLANTSISAITTASACDTANGIGPALYVQTPANSQSTASHMHVTWTSTTDHFADMSNCKTLINETFINAGHNGLVLPNVHTTLLSTYPSQIVIHNFWNAAVTYRVTVYDAGSADFTTGAIRASSGTKMGSKDYTIGANSSLTLSMTTIQAALSPTWTPSSVQFHANLVVTDTSGGSPYAVVSQAVVTPAGDLIDMSNACAVNAVTASSGGGGMNPPPIY